jgi:hypothetical protein
MFVNRGPAIVVNVSQQEMTALLTHAAVAAPVAACRAQRVQEKLDVAWHGFDVVCADRYSVVVPGDDGKLGVRFAGALQSVSYMQVGERWHIESYTDHRQYCVTWDRLESTYGRKNGPLAMMSSRSEVPRPNHEQRGVDRE